MCFLSKLPAEQLRNCWGCCQTDLFFVGRHRSCQPRVVRVSHGSRSIKSKKHTQRISRCVLEILFKVRKMILPKVRWNMGQKNTFFQGFFPSGTDLVGLFGRGNLLDAPPVWLPKALFCFGIPILYIFPKTVGKLWIFQFTSCGLVWLVSSSCFFL